MYALFLCLPEIYLEAAKIIFKKYNCYFYRIDSDLFSANHAALFPSTNLPFLLSARRNLCGCVIESNGLPLKWLAERKGREFFIRKQQQDAKGWRGSHFLGLSTKNEQNSVVRQKNLVIHTTQTEGIHSWSYDTKSVARHNNFVSCKHTLRHWDGLY
jgi:hypothetical protein